MTEQEWKAGWMRGLALMLNGETLDLVDEPGQPITDRSPRQVADCRKHVRSG
jgi:hypothetical protein